MASKLPEISLVICTSRTDLLSEVLIRSLEKQTLGVENFEIILVYYSLDQKVVKQVAPAQTSLSIVCVDLPQLVTISVARNHGIEQARGKYIAFLDEDLIPTDSFLEEHVRLHEANADCQILAVGRSVFAPEHENFVLSRVYLEFGTGNKTAKMKANQSYDYTYVALENLSVEREFLVRESLGFEVLLDNAEGLEWGYRAIGAGASVVLAENAVVLRTKPLSLRSLISDTEDLARWTITVVTKHYELLGELLHVGEITPQRITEWKNFVDNHTENIARSVINIEKVEHRQLAPLSKVQARRELFPIADALLVVLDYYRIRGYVLACEEDRAAARSLNILANLKQRKSIATPLRNNRFVFVMPTFNMEDTVAQTIKSLYVQSYDCWKLLIRDDLSTDNTVKVIREVCQQLGLGSDKVTLVVNTEKAYSLKNCLDCIRECESSDIICRIDGDDWLCDIDALALVNHMYDKYKADALWTMHRYGYSAFNVSGALPDDADPYQYPWVSSHLRTFRKVIIDGIIDGNFKDAKGVYFPRTEDQALYLPVLHLAKKRVFLPICTYHYSCDRPEVFDHDAKSYQLKIAEFIRKRGFVN